jgi:hypothetical protein
MDKLNKTYGTGSILLDSSNNRRYVISTGVLFDYVTLEDF